LKLSTLRVEIYAAEDAFCEAFNQVNTERQYHTFCDSETATEIRQKVHVCKPEFVSDAYVGKALGRYYALTQHYAAVRKE
jgi:hypothetical protein